MVLIYYFKYSDHAVNKSKLIKRINRFQNIILNNYSYIIYNNILNHSAHSDPIFIIIKLSI